MDTEIKRATRVKQVEVDGKEAWEYSDGSIRNDKGHMVKPLPGQFLFTQENAGAMLARRREIGLIAQLRGLCLANDIEPPENATAEELAQLAGVAVGAFTAHMGKTFLKSNSLRGMGEVYNKLVQPLTGDQREKAEIEQGDSINITVMLAEFVLNNYHNSDTRNEKGDVIDVEP